MPSRASQDNFSVRGGNLRNAAQSLACATHSSDCDIIEAEQRLDLLDPKVSIFEE